MVLPISDDNSDRRTTPIVNYALIALNILVFLVPQGLGTNEEFIYRFATVPERILTGTNEPTPRSEMIDPVTGVRVMVPAHEPTPISPYVTLVTSMFLHGGVLHLLGNMLFLWIFGDNIEDAMGHFRYLVFYLLCGVLASLAHVLSTAAFHRDVSIPSLGASGAISGVLGAYLVLFPLRRVTVLLIRFLMDVPAYVAIGLWFGFQLVSALGAMGEGSQVGGVAYGAHIGGFCAGSVLIKLFTLGRPPLEEGPSERWRSERHGSPP